jgi:hypothetical protein
MSFAGKWMGLEIIMLNEISHTQKNKYYVFSHILNPDLIFLNDINIKGRLFGE